MIKRLTLTDFMAHGHTDFELAPGLNVLTGPNNTGKSAVVEGLRCLAQNPAPRHFIRHGAAEARVSAEMDDGTVVTWVRRPKYALYELTRPGATEPEVFAKFGRTPPQEILDVLRLGLVPIEGGDSVDVHIGNQREPVFLINQPGSALSGFFAAATEAAHLIAMQNLLTDRTKKAKAEMSRLDRQLAAVATALDRLAPLPELELRLGAGQALEADLAARERDAAGLASLLGTREALAGRMADRLRAVRTLSRLAGPPGLTPTAALAEHLARGRGLARQSERTSRRREALSRLDAPPLLADTAGLSGHIAGLGKARMLLTRTARKATALSPLTAPRDLAEVAGLRALLSRLQASRRAGRALLGRSRALAGLTPPPVAADVAPLAELAAAVGAARAAVGAARAAVDRLAGELAVLTGRIGARLAALGTCPLCGGQLTTADFLGPGHGHDQSRRTPS